MASTWCRELAIPRENPACQWYYITGCLRWASASYKHKFKIEQSNKENRSYSEYEFLRAFLNWLFAVAQHKTQLTTIPKQIDLDIKENKRLNENLAAKEIIDKTKCNDASPSSYSLEAY